MIGILFIEKRTIEGDFISQCAEKCAYLADLSEFLTKSQKCLKKSQIAVDGIAFAYYNLCVLERDKDRKMSLIKRQNILYKRH